VVGLSRREERPWGLLEFDTPSPVPLFIKNFKLCRQPEAIQFVQTVSIYKMRFDEFYACCPALAR
jgi:hypothetical protein